jgi:hypothetical protein
MFGNDTSYSTEKINNVEAATVPTVNRNILAHRTENVPNSAVYASHTADMRLWKAFEYDFATHKVSIN